MAHASHQVHFNEFLEPVSFEILSLNQAYEQVLGLDRELLIGKNLLDLVPTIGEEPFDWKSLGSRVALSGGETSFFTYSEGLKGWVDGVIFSRRHNSFDVLFKRVDPHWILRASEKLVKERKLRFEKGSALRQEGLSTGEVNRGIRDSLYALMGKGTSGTGDHVLKFIKSNTEVIQGLLGNLREAIIIGDVGGRVLLINQAARDILGIRDSELEDRELARVFQILHPGTGENLTPDILDTLTVQNNFVLNNLALYRHDTGKTVPIEGSLSRMGIQGTGVIILFKDNTVHEKRYRRIEDISYRDHLTDLYNRRYLEEAVKRLDNKRNIPFSVMYIDNNDLKGTNDLNGHPAGDRVIREVASIIKSVCREGDILARVGGDEFEILLPRTSKSQVEQIKKRILKAAGKSSAMGGSLQVSIGCAIKKSADEDLSQIRSQADREMYREKAIQKNARQQE